MNDQIVAELGISQPILEALGAITLNQPHPTQGQEIAALEAIVPAVKNMIQLMYIMAGRVNQSMENSNRLGQEIIAAHTAFANLSADSATAHNASQQAIANLALKMSNVAESNGTVQSSIVQLLSQMGTGTPPIPRAQQSGYKRES